MLKQAGEYCLFGGEKVYFRGKEEQSNGMMYHWESASKDDSGRSLLKIDALCRGDLILRLELTEQREGRPITTAFDSSLKLLRDDQFRNDINYVLLGREHERKLGNLFGQLRAFYHLHSSNELFRIRALKIQEEVKQPYPQEFSTTSKIRKHKDSLQVYFPVELSKAAGFRTGTAGELSFEDGSLVFTPFRKMRHAVEISKTGYVTIPEEFVYLKGIYADTRLKCTEEEPGRLSLSIAGESDKRSLKVHYFGSSNQYSVTIPAGFVGQKVHGIWSEEGEKLILELSENLRYIVLFNILDRHYCKEFQVYIPHELVKKTGLQSWDEVRFAIDGLGRVVISPKEK